MKKGSKSLNSETAPGRFLRLVSKFSIRLSLASLIISFLVVPTTIANADIVSSVVLVSPAAGSVFNPRLSFPVTIDLIGGAAAKANSCDDGELTNFKFAMAAIDGANYGLGFALSVNRNGGQWFAGEGDNLGGWVGKIIPNGIECTMYATKDSGVWDALNSTGMAWFGAKSPTYINGQDEYGVAQKLDIAWQLNSTIVHHVFQTTSEGTFNVELLGLSRGQTVNYSASFEVSGSVRSDYVLTQLSATGNFSNKDVTCSDTPRSSLNGNIATYTTNCTISLANAESYPPTIQITPTIAAHSPVIWNGSTTSVSRINGDPITINTGEIGVPQFEINSSPGSLISKDQSKPWTTPAVFSLKGRVCSDVGGLGCFSSPPLQGAIIKICIAAVCENAKSAADGTFSYAKTVNTSTVRWTASATWKNISLQPADFVCCGPSYVGFYRTEVVDSTSMAETVSLPKAPAAPLTAAQKKANATALYNYGVKVMNSLTSTQLAQIGFLKFFLPGHKSLTNSSAMDFCRQLPTVIPGLSQQVGLLADPNFVAGCAAAAVKIKQK